MVVPDFDLICEILLVAEGFMEAQILSQKFITLYSLCKELLSKQDHYDWGLRAIKSVLVVAGSLKRKEPEIPENQILMRALRDFNIPKIVADDTSIFLGLIGDLFPSLNVPRKRDLKFEEIVKKATIALKLQPEECFILKVVQLEELLKVRHSVFVVGNTGTGKTQVCKTLMNTYKIQKLHPISYNLNPKVVTNDELFGVVNPSTREWKDGLFSVIMRNLANAPGNGPKWIILDGDIDPMWIESLNTVMDDNKVLTLASNERIPLTPSMRLVFEIASLETATPATVSRAGILYLNPTDLDWNPYVTSWIEERKLQSEKTNLMILFEKYIPACLQQTRKRFKKIIPVTEISQIQMLCYLLDCLLSQHSIELSKETYEIYFVFACVWAFGACLFQEHLIDYRVEFSKWWLSEFKTVKFPSSGTVFDFYIDQESKRFVSWTEKIPGFKLDFEQPLQNALVHTIETTRIRFFLDLLMHRQHPVMLVGNTGSGKTVLINEKLEDLSDDYMVIKIPFNFYTTSEMLQKVMEKSLEKKAGRNFGPPGTKRMIYFIDDMNMPEVDTYGTVQPHTLIRQHLDYKHWYDRTKLTLKRIHNCQYVSCMNPTAGSFTINPRLQRHFCVFAVSYPNFESLIKIYHSILYQYLTDPFSRISSSVSKSTKALVFTAISFHQKISQTYFPTAFKFHYFFNLRDLSNIFQGLLFGTTECLKDTIDLLQLWIHECRRVYRDKLVDENDLKQFDKIIIDIIRKTFQVEDINYEVIEKERPLYCHFNEGTAISKYMPVVDKNNLYKILVNSLNSYNEIHAAMNIVLFEDAVEHICRISRILRFPRGNALLVGVGGSGKQSLARLSSFINDYDTFQIVLRKGYGINDLKGDLAILYEKTGLKNFEVMFLMTDAEVGDEKFLVLINDLLSSGEIPGLFSDEDAENIINHFRNEVKSLGLIDTKENCWKCFIAKVQQKIKVVLSFSPVGTTLRVRSRKFPALINCTCINWFHKWPQEALLSVSQKFLGDIQVLSDELKDSVSLFMSYVHTSVEEISKVFLINEHRYNYTTPKTFLELIKLYENLLQTKLNELHSNIQRLENGLDKLLLTEDEVQKLHIILTDQEIQIKQKTESTNHLLTIVAAETEKVKAEKKIAAEEKDKVEAITIEVSKKKEDCEKDLAKAEPAVIAASEALNTLDKNNLTELKSFGSPPPGIEKVTAAVMILLCKNGQIPKDRSWKAAKAMMGRVDLFMERLVTFDKENIHKNCLKAIAPLITDKNFNPEIIRKKSFAAAGLCSWVLNIIKYYEVYCEVEPKRIALNEAKTELEIAVEKYEQIQAKVIELEEKLNTLKEQFQKAADEKLKIEKEAEKTNEKISLANRLVNGLASEKVRWTESIERYKIQEKTLPGDILITAAFISYVGCFTKKYRLDLMEKHWMPFLKKLNKPIPVSENLDPLALLIDDVTIAQWNNQGLPQDRMSTENATILKNTKRWPLMIDPQLQGINWIKNEYGTKLKILRLEEKSYLDKIEEALSAGNTVLIENIGENLDPVLNPLLSRNTIKKGKAIQLGDKEIEFHDDFCLILQTKLANPHYKPEIQAQTTLINFTVTKDGLEDQLLEKVVSKERPDLENKKASLTKQQNYFKITLKKYEDSLLSRLSTATGNILDNYELVENLETTKQTATEITEKVKLANQTEKDINVARELYRTVAARASLLYFILNDLYKINLIYQFSLKAFNNVFYKAIEKNKFSDDIEQRTENLIDSITYSIFMYTARGLFEDDKIIFTTQMVFQILKMNDEIDPILLDFLLRFPSVPNSISPVQFLSNYSWGAIKVLSSMDQFRNLDKEIEGSAKRWYKFVDSEAPEKEKFPQEWKNKIALERLCMMRCLRPDRMVYAILLFIEEKLGNKYVESRNIEFSKSFEESSPSTPIFFILSPGVDPLKDVENHGEKMGYTTDNKNFHNVSLGQGQEIVAENALDIASQKGHWVILQNIHLVQKWLPNLEKKLEQYFEDSHPNFRVFMSAEPAESPETHIIPHGILESAIKITNEPPRGMLANLHRAFDNFDQDVLESCSKEMEFKSILFSLCYFHAVVAERRKFGPQGWNKIYPFNFGDLIISVNVLQNYLENSSKVPWEDLRYLFGEIMYGGHITDDWDRRLCKTYLEEYMAPELLDGELMFASGICCPPNLDYNGYHKYIDETILSESPHLYGLHPNAEIGFLTQASENLFGSLLELQPRDINLGEGTTTTREERITQIIDDIMERLPSQFILADLFTRAEDKTPYTVVAFQECERMNFLLNEIQNSLKELNLGLKGELTITAEMEELENSLFLDHVPKTWTKRAYPSLLGFTAWYCDLILRAKDLESWVNDFVLPSSVWLSGFFNPQSFLTAVMQVTARKNELPLDKMCLQCEVTKKNREDFTSPPREGAYIHGLYMEGARWNTSTNLIDDAQLKELYPEMPVIYVKAILSEKQEIKNTFECPLYRTRERGNTYIWTFNLRTKANTSKWIIGGVALLLEK
ncbi:dynein beta chain, ciliary-like isoform X1 [Centruroides sculpturatus]|uniref:dynein beta chain, ciliary-like isoform X1 n=2 Tax=Centruroides sculpturatus TaxID=218467 RepID=UPI000C6D5FFB|nr:dynein beta chain, ciliary-like isoform X1 [Centruroides sculpturatus]